MIIINFSDSSTINLDLFDDKQLQEYKSKLKNPFFIKRITGMSIYKNKQLYTIQKPNKFNSLQWECGKVAIAKLINNQTYSKSKDVGESISLFINNNIKHTLIYYFSNKMIKSSILFLDKTESSSSKGE